LEGIDKRSLKNPSKSEKLRKRHPRRERKMENQVDDHQTLSENVVADIE
jgi:hypothetical protein